MDHKIITSVLGYLGRIFYSADKGSLKTNEDSLNLITTKAKHVNPNILLIELGTNDVAVKAIEEK